MTPSPAWPRRCDSYPPSWSRGRAWPSRPAVATCPSRGLSTGEGERGIPRTLKSSRSLFCCLLLLLSSRSRARAISFLPSDVPDGMYHPHPRPHPRVHTHTHSDFLDDVDDKKNGLRKLGVASRLSECLKVRVSVRLGFAAVAGWLIACLKDSAPMPASPQPLHHTVAQPLTEHVTTLLRTSRLATESLRR